MDSPNRRFIRPPLVEPKEQPNQQRRNNDHQNRKNIPPEQTNAENFYYLKQMQARTPMVVVLHDGETLEGVIEWYDKGSLKIHRDGQPNLLVFKSSIKYLYKASG